eukprot:Sdes_comp19927_c0_seq2m12371
MILLEFHNRIVQETLSSRFSASKAENVEITIADFDSVSYHISTPESKTKILVSIRLPCFHELIPIGVKDVIQREYGAYVAATTENDYDLTLQFDLETLSAPEKENLPHKVALLKRNLLACAFEKYFQLQKTQSSTLTATPTATPTILHYRQEESIFLDAQKDRVTIIFSIFFRDQDDIILGKVFLQEFVDARRNLQQAPQVLFSHREPPRELVGTDAKTGENFGYVTFVLFPRHYEKPASQEASINLIHTFRDYLHYHIKCSKAYLHSRMRARVSSMLKIMNRARPQQDLSVEKKTASGKTFVRR